MIGGILHMLRIAVWQSVLCQDRMHLGVVLAHLSEYVEHLTHDVLTLLRRPFDDLHDSLLTRLTALELTFGDKHVVDKQVAIGYQEGEIALYLQRSYHLIVGPAYNLCHHCLFDMLLATCHEGHPHTVAVHRKLRVTLSHEHRFVGTICQKRVLSVSLTDESTLLHLTAEVQLVGVV